MKPFRNIYIKEREENMGDLLSGTLDIPYTGEIFYGNDDPEYEPEGYDPEVDVYYRCNCEFHEIRSFVKVEVKE